MSQMVIKIGCNETSWSEKTLYQVKLQALLIWFAYPEHII